MTSCWTSCATWWPAALWLPTPKSHEKFVKDNTKVKFDYAVLRKEDILKTIHPAKLN